MKKLIFILSICLILFAVLAAGCLGGNEPSDNISNNSSNNTSNNSSNYTPPIAPPIAPPADTARFFGIVTDIKTVNNTTEIVLNSQISFIFLDSSRMNFNLSELKTQQYIEVYSIPFDVDSSQDSVPVIIANLLNVAHFNGQIVNVTPSSPESFSDIQSIEVRWSNDGMIFYCNGTQFDMDFQDITIGPYVGVAYDENTFLKGMPPQAKAFRVQYEYFCG